ncbi:hypothetical protein P152DRAFT_460211 [Eremomyces bilateralis CBS 781.70]|uniref:Zn(2)-C6 fungal-type domain-containing protein n=1 Tax=Eremomyces bilateralis CBS 781.70 TaxID=1392243 RepID=A0A6G1FYS0_9PEZI|nr:uncharacterized protein P152DRAFT_460211 [Eremomyces bilateralis CBS 781.70]KAF1810918.1 hypothetical protein P152DRAFT_460211 [Eremomyces bilateralis CBS 781.70]
METNMPVERGRRPRVAQACNTCRAKKYKCDGHIPCSHCRRQGRECIFQREPNGTVRRSEYSIRYVKELEESLERAKAALRLLGTSQQHETDLTPTGNTAPEAGAQPSLQNVPRPIHGENQSDSSISRAAAGAPTGDQNKDIAENSPDEVMDINGSTRSFEFHGPTSSLAFLYRLVKMKESSSNNGCGRHPAPGFANRQVISEFQNEAFMKLRESPNLVEENYYPLHALLFIDSYFKTLHYVYPIIDQNVFLERCHSLWTGHGIPIHQSFKALYFAVLSLGVLTRTWTEGSINGMDRNAWTLTLFERAELTMGRPGSLNDLEAIQALIIMSQVCQHQLNPNLAYTYLGTALRTAFSTGINRLAQFRERGFPQDSPSLVVSRTWWALYSLETESSFNISRPDILGLDSYHNRLPPSISEPNETETTIIPAMLGLSRILRQISKNIYWEPTGLSEKLQRASEYEHDLSTWLARLPANIRPNSRSETTNPRLMLDNHCWPELQMLVLNLRYLHARIVLFYLFFLHGQRGLRNGKEVERLTAYAQNCKDAAVDIIKSIHSAYRMHHFFRSWWNNTTYLTFGLSIILSAFYHEPVTTRPYSANLLYINQAIEILGAMEECRVARNIGKFARELVGELLAGQMDGGSGSQTASAPLEPSVPWLADGFSDPHFEFNVFDENFPMWLDDVEQDVSASGIQGLSRGDIV